MASDGDNPNVNMFPLESAENSINETMRNLLSIEPTDDTQAELKNMCIADLKEFQDGNLFALRRAIE